MPKYLHKAREVEAIDYKVEVENFLKSGKVAFIPYDQRDTNRYHWHRAGEEVGVATKTLKLWRKIFVCGIHKHPIIGIKPSINPYSQAYDSDYECDYECNEDGEDGCISNCCYRDDYKVLKMRTVVVFNTESSHKIKDLHVTQIKDYLVTYGIVKKENSQYCV